MASQRAEAAPEGFYCSTSGTTFTEREALADHYRSDLHRYNLKRKVAGVQGRAIFLFVSWVVHDHQANQSS